MLRSIGGYFEKKKKAVDKYQGKSDEIKQNLKSFLADKFGESIRGLSLNMEYNSKENSLILITSNKIVANELSLYLADIVEHLKNKNINLNKIYIK